MATDNRTDNRTDNDLFPDVLEHYGNDDIGMRGDVDFPVPQENYETEYTTDDDAGDDDVMLPLVGIDPQPIAYESEPLPVGGFSVDQDVTTVLPVYVPDAVVDPVVEHYGAAEDTTAEATFDNDSAAALGVDEDDPYAGAPDWVRAHIPRGPLTAPESTRRGISGRIPRRPARTAVEAAELPTEQIAVEPKAPKVRKPPKVKTVRDLSDGSRSPWLLGGAAAAVIAVVIGGAAVAFSGSDDGGEVAAPPLPSSSKTAGPTIAEAPAWCASSAAGGKVVGNGPGDQTSGPGLIQAFDYAYYVQRDAAKVSSMYVTPQPLPPLQESIDMAAALGTEHCLTIAPTANANVFDVQLQLRAASGTESGATQRITLAQAGSGLKIAALEEIPQ
ncbi:hypothetical protein [Rhodococcus erythropolis]|uniref:DUF8176 domain-containing protein n=1 Tax=Rhodococcus erythropolis (strain PR4 / NBRC 100887) TaxID=234621 RepID=Q3L924_RHOE4|nr:hypothetical protein [Rhodococcus erythropolis]BAE46289.1 conserved hypothetical protein [Rhodococcus erythropolis PR4]